METAIGNRPDVAFPPAQTTPQWTSWQGQYEYSGAYGAYGTSTATATTGTTDVAHDESCAHDDGVVGADRADDDVRPAAAAVDGGDADRSSADHLGRPSRAVGV